MQKEEEKKKAKKQEDANDPVNIATEVVDSSDEEDDGTHDYAGSPPEATPSRRSTRPAQEAEQVSATW